jgi:all-trans-retinol dehydrogenase (NAD+)
LTTPLGEHSKEFPKDILDPKDIADAIISQVVSGNGGQIFCPSFLSVLSGIRGFPHWMQESIRGSQKSTIKV